MKIRLFFAAATLMFCSFVNQTVAQSIDELEDKVEDFVEEAQEVYKLDDQSLQLIWEAYCGQLDPNELESKQYATEIGSQLQQKEEDELDEIIYKASPLKDALKPMLDNSETKDKAEDLIESIDKEVEKLNQIKKGAILRGSDHPFVKFALEYGKKMHDDMKDDYGSYYIYDQEFSGVYGRPDLVYIDNSGGLYILEFKPDNDRAKSKGWKQVEGYMPGVVAFFQKCFPNGRNGEIVTNSPASDSFLKELQKCNAAWDSEGKNIICHIDVKTYRICEKRFDQ